MVKHTARRRKFRRYLKGNLDEQIGIGTLAGRTLVRAGGDEQVSERTWVTSMVASWILSEVTLAANVGPLLVGIAHSDYSAAEIEEFIENTGSWDEGDLVQQEVAKRKIRVVGTFPIGISATGWDVLNEGRPIKTKLGWYLTTGDGIAYWAYNLGSAAFSATVPEIDIQGHINLWPQ